MALILVVEDDAVNQEVVTSFLQRAGHRVIQAVNGADGVKQAQNQSPDLILMDLSLPEMDGWEATRRIKRNPRTWDIPVIALTAHTDAAGVMKAQEAGCDDYEVKPVVYTHLMSKIRGHLEQSPGGNTVLSRQRIPAV